MKKIVLFGFILVLNEPVGREQLSSLRFFYKKDGQWEPVANTIEKEKNSFRYKIIFNPLLTDALRIKEEKGDAITETELYSG